MQKVQQDVTGILPYTVAGFQSMPVPRTAISLTAEGVKELAKRMNKGDYARIIIESDWLNGREINTRWKIIITRK